MERTPQRWVSGRAAGASRAWLGAFALCLGARVAAAEAPPAAPLAAPPAAAASTSVTLELVDAPLVEIAGALARLTGRTAFVADGITGSASVLLVGAPLAAAEAHLVQILESRGLAVSRTADTLDVRPRGAVDPPLRPVEPAAPAPPVAAPPSAAAAPPPGLPPLRAAERCPGTVPPSAFGVIGAPTELRRQFFASPHHAPDGFIDGLRLSGVKRATAAGALGLRSGDVVMRVEAPGARWEARQPREALDAALFAATRPGASTRFRVQRAGERVDWVCVVSGSPAPPDPDPSRPLYGPVPPPRSLP